MSAQKTHTNDEKTRETAKKAAKNAIFFDKLKQCKREANESKKRSETKQNANIIVIA